MQNIQRETVSESERVIDIRSETVRDRQILSETKRQSER